MSTPESLKVVILAQNIHPDTSLSLDWDTQGFQGAINVPYVSLLFTCLN